MAQLELAAGQGNFEKQREYLWRVADCYDKAGRLDTAQSHLTELLGMDLSKEQKLEALCFLADIQARGRACCLATGATIVTSLTLPFIHLPSEKSASRMVWRGFYI